MTKGIKRILFITLLGLSLAQLSACDEVKRFVDGCSSNSDNGATNIDC